MEFIDSVGPTSVSAAETTARLRARFVTNRDGLRRAPLFRSADRIDECCSSDQYRRRQPADRVYQKGEEEVLEAW